MLESAGLLTGLEKYAGDIIRKRSSKPKFQVFNNALLSSQMNESFNWSLENHTVWGRLVESAIGTHLLNYAIRGNFNLYYWNEDNYEVDYVIEKNGIRIGIEVKSGKDSYNKGMALFDEKFHPKYLFTVGTDGIPVEEFLTSNPSLLFDLT
jgi:predicted AAA+ superfamily ATPase